MLSISCRENLNQFLAGKDWFEHVMRVVQQHRPKLSSSPDEGTSDMDLELLGKVLATVVTASVDAGAIIVSSGSILKDPSAVGAIVQGFLQIWLTHPASGNPQAQAK